MKTLPLLPLSILWLCLTCPAWPALAQTLPHDAAADYSAKYGGRALLIMVDGKTVYERYDNGWSASRPHPLASGTKSFSGIMAAAAIEDGIIPGWDDLICNTLTAWKDDPEKSQITLRMLLDLSSGLDPSDPSLESRGGGRVLGDGATRRTKRIESSNVQEAGDKFAAVQQTKMAGKPGKQFQYGSSHFHAFGAYLTERLRLTNRPEKTVEEYFRQRIAKPLNMTIGFWTKDSAGNLNLPGGALLTARQWAKFGECVRLNGAVVLEDGTKKQILKPELLAECLKPSANNPRYGLTWWLPSNSADLSGADTGDATERLRQQLVQAQTRGLTEPNGTPITAYMAAGLGKQRLLILPKYNMVIVRFAEATADGQRYDDAELVRLILGR